MRIIKVKGYGNKLGMKLEYPIFIDRSKKYEIALIGWFTVYNSLTLGKKYEIKIDNKKIVVPKGFYTVDSLERAIISFLNSNDSQLDNNLTDNLATTEINHESSFLRCNEKGEIFFWRMMMALYKFVPPSKLN